MIRSGVLRGSFLCLFLLAALPHVEAQQTGVPGSNGGGTTGSTPGGNTGGNTDRKPSPDGNSRPGNQQQPNLNRPQDQQRRQESLIFISGTVVQEDGTPPPSGTMIERVCNGQSKREAYVDGSGYFTFQLGANNGVIPDASENTFANFGSSASSQFSVGGFGSPMNLMGCEFRAQLAGYRSTVAIYRGEQTIGHFDVGTLVLYPIAKIMGTMVSVADMQAPKDAKKGFERAKKILSKNKLDEAVQQLQTVVGIYPRYASAWFEMGKVYLRQDRTADARMALMKAVEIDGNFVNPYIELARMEGAAQNWQHVLELTDRALTLDPLDFPAGFHLNAVANYYLNNLDAAERSVRKTQRLDPEHRFPQGHLILANIFRKKHDAAAETDQLRSYLKYAPKGPNADEVRSRLEQLAHPSAPVASNGPK